MHTLCSSLQHVLSLLSLLCVHQSLPGNGFQRHRSLNFCVHGLMSSLTVTSLTTQQTNSLHSTWSVESYSLRVDSRENIIPLLMRVAWYHMFLCSSTVRLVPDCMATPLPAAILLLHDVTADVMCSSVVCAIIITLISCLPGHNLVMALYMLQYLWSWKLRLEAVYSSKMSVNFYWTTWYQDSRRWQMSVNAVQTSNPILISVFCSYNFLVCIFLLTYSSWWWELESTPNNFNK
jgi:hypothetical protein